MCRAKVSALSAVTPTGMLTAHSALALPAAIRPGTQRDIFRIIEITLRAVVPALIGCCGFPVCSRQFTRLCVCDLAAKKLAKCTECLFGMQSPGNHLSQENHMKNNGFQLDAPHNRGLYQHRSYAICAAARYRLATNDVLRVWAAGRRPRRAHTPVRDSVSARRCCCRRALARATWRFDPCR